jgi:hypothetical protein
MKVAEIRKQDCFMRSSSLKRVPKRLHNFGRIERLLKRMGELEYFKRFEHQSSSTHSDWIVRGFQVEIRLSPALDTNKLV